jgi:predicted membrane protein
VCKQVGLSICICFLCLFGGFFSFCWVVLPYSNVLVLLYLLYYIIILYCITLHYIIFIIYYIILYYIPLETCFFLMKDRKGADPNGRRSKEEPKDVES